MRLIDHKPLKMKLPVPIGATDSVMLCDLRLFGKAVGLGSLAEAARVLGLSKTSVTRQLQRLEGAIGQRLLHRGSGRFALTEEGRELLMQICDAVAAIDDAVTGLADRSGRLEGRLRIAAPHTFGRTVIAPVLAPFMALHPEVNVTLELSSRRVDLLADEADIAFRVGNPGSERLIARRLARDQVILCAAPDYLRARPPLALISDLVGHIALDFRPAPVTGVFEISDAAGRMRQLDSMTVSLRSNEPTVLAIAAERGAGIAIVPESFVRAQIAAGTLNVVLPGCGLPAVDINALYAPGRRQSPKIRAFLDHLILSLS